jgi:hypothetical protein
MANLLRKKLALKRKQRRKENKDVDRFRNALSEFVDN